MSLPRGVRRMLRLRDADRDVADELAFHFEEAVAELRASGLTEADARREASRRFGDVASYRRQLERIDRGRLQAERGMRRWEAVRDVATHAVRSVRRSPALSAAVVVTLALGLGANVTVYGILDRLLLSPPPQLERPEEVRRLMTEQYQGWRDERVAMQALSFPDFTDMTSAPGIAAAIAWQPQRLTLGHGAEAREIDGLVVTGGYFRFRGVQPVLGRFIDEGDDDPAAERAAVISYEFWQREYGGSHAVLGTGISFGGDPYSIVGVAPRGLTNLHLTRVDVWLPLRRAMAPSIVEGRNWHGFAGAVRLADPAAETAVADAASQRLRQGREEFIAAGTYDAAAQALLTPVIESRGPQPRLEAAVAPWLAGVSLIVLLIACVNVANLLLARAVRQSRETAVRLALGISRRRLVAQVLAEGVLLGVLGGAAALLLATWSGAAAATLLLPELAWQELGRPAGVLPLSLAAAALTGVLAALAAAVHVVRPAMAGGLRQAGGGGTRTAARVRSTLSLVQAALSVILLVGAGLFVRSLEAVRGVDLGMQLEGLTYVETRFVTGTTPEERQQVRHAVLERLAGHPELAGVAAGSTAPMLWSMSNNIRLPGRDTLPRIGSGDHWTYIVTPGYFDLLGIRLLQGRVFDEADVRTGARVAVVNETMSRALWPGGDAVGSCILLSGDDDCVFVVGVVQDTRQQHFRQEGTAQYFLPLTAQHDATVIMARTRDGDGVRLATLLPGMVAGMDPRIRFVEVTHAPDKLAPQQRAWRLGATLFTAFGILALLVAALGLYAVLAFDVSQRTREIGIRGALGAGRGDVVRLVLRQALTVAGAGILLGVTAAALLAPRMEEMLYGVGPHDAATYGVVALTLLGAAVLAGLVPARRAAAVDPAVALRGE